MDIILVIAGLIVLLFAGDMLVKGAVSLSLRLGVPALIVSLTIVAFGTSAPEMLIAVQSALEGAPGIAVGNVVGSNTANVLLVLGIPAIISSFSMRHMDCQRTFGQMIAASVIFVALCFRQPLHFWQAFVLLGLLAAMLADAFRAAQVARRGVNIDNVTAEALSELADADPTMPAWRIAFYLVIGLIGLPLGADLLVDGAVSIATHYQVKQEVIGLTLVAVGTSLPELATTVMAALRRQADVAFGNVIGSNMFNVLAIMGIASLFGPIDVADNFLRLDLWVMLASSLLLVPFIYLRLNLNRIWGVAFVGAYVVYLAVILGQ